MSKEIPPDHKIKIFNALERPDYDWRTLNGICSETGLPAEEVIEVIKTSPEVVESTRPSTTGESLFTTRAHFRSTAPATDRLIGAFKNRLL
jgi:hypothetical protein